METLEKAEMVSPQTLAEMWDMQVTTIWKYAREAQANPGPNSFPCGRLPGKRAIRIPLKEAREWFARGRFR